MATISRQLFPTLFSNQYIGPHRKLPLLLHHRPNFGVGTRVMRREWYERGWHDCYWDITDVKLDEQDHTKSLSIHGLQTLHGRRTSTTPQEIPARQVTENGWMVHYTPADEIAIAQKIKLVPKDQSDPLPQPEDGKELTEEQKLESGVGYYF
ncbi:hypothetical protein HDV00_002234 [Rhizophlyctis rosea]|nr:hypothetical protein HDV00_002234 [Rhizophlyctis rosea]